MRHRRGNSSPTAAFRVHPSWASGSGHRWLEHWHVLFGAADTSTALDTAGVLWPAAGAHRTSSVISRVLATARAHESDADPAPLEPAPASATATAPASASAPAAPAVTVASPPDTDAVSTDTATWACIRLHESGNRYNSPTAPSGAYGILDSTWVSLGYSGWPYQAPVTVQDAAALTLYHEYGWQPWSTRFVCGL
jgi:hypothetical protein